MMCWVRIEYKVILLHDVQTKYFLVDVVDLFFDYYDLIIIIDVCVLLSFVMHASEIHFCVGFCDFCGLHATNVDS